MLAEIQGLSPDSAAAWAKTMLGTKNRLTVEDAQLVETAFETRLASLANQCGHLLRGFLITFYFICGIENFLRQFGDFFGEPTNFNSEGNKRARLDQFRVYVSRWIADEASGRQYLTLGQGLWDVWNRRHVTFEWDAWQSEIPWMSLYFTVAVWCSIALAHVPRLLGHTKLEYGLENG